MKTFLKALPRHIKVQLWLLLAFPVNLLLLLLADCFPAFIEEIYAEKIRPVCLKVIGFLPGLLPFSLAEVLILFAVLGAAVWLVFFILRVKRRGEKLSLLLFDVLTRLLSLTLCGILLFNLLYGLCYYRKNTCVYSLDIHIDYEDEDIAHIASYMTLQLNEARKKAGLNEKEPYSFRLSYEELAEGCREAYRLLGERYPVYAGDYGNPKPVALSVPWTYTYVMGMYFPFTGEANYNTNIPSVELSHTVLHEMAHQRGIAAEDEANYAAFLAGLYATDTRIAYSALFESWSLVMSTLHRRNGNLYQSVLSLADEGVLSDLAYVDAFWASYSGSLASFSDDVNRVYLESNGVKFGTASYSLSVQYILDYYVNNDLREYVVINE